jgi:hypothetical protein
MLTELLRNKELITWKSKSHRDDTLLTVHFSVRTTDGPLSKSRRDGTSYRRFQVPSRAGLRTGGDRLCRKLKHTVNKVSSLQGLAFPKLFYFVYLASLRGLEK